MNYTQNEKIKQVKKETLVVGVDIAKKHHVARAQDYRGIQYDKPFSFENNYLGFNEFLYWTKKVAKKNDKSEFIVGMEPTGHYWLNIEQFLRSNDIKLVLVNPAHVKKSKSLDDNSPTKNDKKDAKVIAQLVKDGRYSEPNIPEDVYAELRVAMTHRERLVKDLVRIKNKIIQWIDKFFPEFLDVFKSWEGKAALAILSEIPLPEDIVDLSTDEILTVIKKGATRGVGIKRAEKLKETAHKSIGLTEGLKMASIELNNLLQQYDILTSQLETLEEEVKGLLEEVPGAKEMESIKGVGTITIAGFVAEIGDIRNYDHPRQIQRLSGLNLVENSSGKHKGKTKISKRGRPKLRSLLYRVTLSLIGKNNEFNTLYNYYTNRTKNPLKSQQARVALVCKLIRILFALGKKQVKYDGEKMLNDIVRNQDISGKLAA